MAESDRNKNTKAAPADSAQTGATQMGGAQADRALSGAAGGDPSDSSEKKLSAGLKVYVVTPFEIFYEGFCNMLVIPASDGELGIMRGHTPVVTALYPGELRIRLESGLWRYAFVSNGYAQIEHNYVMVVCTSAEWAEDIDLERVQESLQRAQERIEDKSLSPAQIKRAAHAIRRAKNRLKVLEKARQRAVDQTQLSR